MDGIAAMDVTSLIINQAQQQAQQNVMMQAGTYAIKKSQDMQRNTVMQLLGIGGNVNALA